MKTNMRERSRGIRCHVTSQARRSHDGRLRMTKTNLEAPHSLLLSGLASFSCGAVVLFDRSSPFPPDKGAFGPAASALAAGGDWEGAIGLLKVRQS